MGDYTGYFYLLVVVVLGILIRILTPIVKGWCGEKIVATILSSLPESDYRVLNNIMLRTNYGTTQIDHIIVSLYGIFVIETKNYKGWITGSEFGDNWTKNMYGKKYSFRNPLKQNYAHVKALETLLGLDEDRFIPIVAFSWNSDIKVKTKKPVVYISQLRRVILSYQQEKIYINDIKHIAERIICANVDSKDNRKEHVSSIRNKVKENDVKVSNNICPRCGGTLVKRKGKYGSFTGCGNYPKCKYTLN
jgi:ribosomal protein S27AE